MKEHILIVDDEEMIRDLLSSALQQDKYVCHQAANVDEAFIILGKQQIDLVISDIMMPGRSGVELLRDLKKIDPDITVLIPLTEVLKINLYEIIGGEILNEENKDEILKETIEFSSNEIKKSKSKYLRIITVLVAVFILIISTYYLVDSGLDIHIKDINYKNGNAVLVKTSENNYDIYINVTQTISSKIIPDLETDDNFIRLGGEICVDYQSNTVRFYIPENSVINNVYYIEKRLSEFDTLDDKQLMNFVDRKLVWSRID